MFFHFLWLLILSHPLCYEYFSVHKRVQNKPNPPKKSLKAFFSNGEKSFNSVHTLFYIINDHALLSLSFAACLKYWESHLSKYFEKRMNGGVGGVIINYIFGTLTSADGKELCRSVSTISLQLIPKRIVNFLFILMYRCDIFTHSNLSTSLPSQTKLVFCLVVEFEYSANIHNNSVPKNCLQKSFFKTQKTQFVWAQIHSNSYVKFLKEFDLYSLILLLTTLFNPYQYHKSESVFVCPSFHFKTEQRIDGIDCIRDSCMVGEWRR